MSIEEISDTGDQAIRKAAIDLLTGGKAGIDYALRVWGLAAGPLGSVKWDSWDISRTATTDVVTWYDGGLSGTAKITFTATYTNQRKKEVLSGVWAVL